MFKEIKEKLAWYKYFLPSDAKDAFADAKYLFNALRSERKRGKDSELPKQYNGIFLIWTGVHSESEGDTHLMFLRKN